MGLVVGLLHEVLSFPKFPLQLNNSPCPHEDEEEVLGDDPKLLSLA